MKVVKYLNLIGSKFDKLVIIALAGKTKDCRLQVLCSCDCGNFLAVALRSLKSGNTKTCGCSRLYCFDGVNVKHGMSSSITYKSWRSMLDRTTNFNSKDYKNYGGRGIKVCDRWLNSFENFLEDMGERPDKRFSIDRVDNNGNY